MTSVAAGPLTFSLCLNLLLSLFLPRVIHLTPIDDVVVSLSRTEKGRSTHAQAMLLYFGL